MGLRDYIKNKTKKKIRRILIITAVLAVLVIVLIINITMTANTFMAMSMSAIINNITEDVKDIIENATDINNKCPEGCRKVYKSATMAGTTGSLGGTDPNNQMVALTSVVSEQLGVPAFTVYGINATENGGSIAKGNAYASANADIYTELMLCIKNDNDPSKYFENGDAKTGTIKDIMEAIGPFQIMAGNAGSFATDIPNELITKAGGIVASDITNRGIGEQPLTGTGNPLYFPDATYGIMMKLNWALLDNGQVKKMTDDIEGFDSLDDRVKGLVRVMLFEGYYHYSNTKWWDGNKKFGDFCVDIAEAYIDNPAIYSDTLAETSWNQADSNDNKTVIYLIGLVDPTGDKGYLAEFKSSKGGARATWTLGPKAGIMGDALYNEAVKAAGGETGGYVWDCPCSIPCNYCDCHNGESGSVNGAITEFGNWGTVVKNSRGYSLPLVYPTTVHIDGRFNSWRTNHWHSGVDLNGGSGADDAGAPVVAFYDGTVTKVMTAEEGIAQIHILHYLPMDSGTTLRVTTVYKHLEDETYRDYVKVGDKVISGQQIGQCSDTGSEGSVHLHFEMWYGSTRQTSFNPMANYLSDMGIENNTGCRDDLVYKAMSLN